MAGKNSAIFATFISSIYPHQRSFIVNGNNTINWTNDVSNRDPSSDYWGGKWKRERSDGRTKLGK